MPENQVKYDFNPDGKQLAELLEEGAAVTADKAQELASPGTTKESWQCKSGQAGSLFESFYHAFNGLALGFRRQRNVRIHTFLGLFVFALAFCLKVDPWQWIALTVAIGFVFFAEFVNTAIEHMVDIQANYRYHLSARYAKDTAAAAVLVAAITAAIVGAVIFLPRLCSLVRMGTI